MKLHVKSGLFPCLVIVIVIMIISVILLHKMPERTRASLGNGKAAGTPWAVHETYMEDDAFLCEPSTKQFIATHGNKHSNTHFKLCPGFITVEQGGRLGNHMWEYASVWALAQEFLASGKLLKPLVPQCLRQVLDDAFPHLSIPEFHPRVHRNDCGYGHEPKPIEKLSREDILDILKTNPYNEKLDNIVLKRWMALPEIVLPRIQQLKSKDFIFRDELLADSRQILMSVAQNISCETTAKIYSTDITYIGVHVRRTDYYNYLLRNNLYKSKHSIFASASYFHKAMDHFRMHFKSCLAFLVVSDDIQWCSEHLTQNKGHLDDVFVVTRNGYDAPLYDLALLASCNHSIIDYGTFGVWGALLAGGNTLVYHLPGPAGKHTNAIEVARAMPNWKLFPP